MRSSKNGSEFEVDFVSIDQTFLIKEYESYKQFNDVGVTDICITKGKEPV